MEPHGWECIFRCSVKKLDFDGSTFTKECLNGLDLINRCYNFRILEQAIKWVFFNIDIVKGVFLGVWCFFLWIRILMPLIWVHGLCGISSCSSWSSCLSWSSWFSFISNICLSFWFSYRWRNICICYCNLLDCIYGFSWLNFFSCLCLLSFLSLFSFLILLSCLWLFE